MPANKQVLLTATAASHNSGRPGAKFAVFALILAIGFIMPLYGLLRYAASSELSSAK